MKIEHDIDEAALIAARDSVLKKITKAGKMPPGQSDITLTIWEAQALLNVLDEVHQEIFEEK